MENFAVGKPTPLLDGQAKVSGQTRYVGDLKMRGMLHARLVVSVYAHANVKRIDTSEALAVSGVHSVITAADLPYVTPSSRNKLMLARDRVLFVGHPIAVVLAETEAAAADAAEKVHIDYEPLAAVVTMDEAMAEDAPIIWPTGVPSGAGDEGAHGADVGGDEKGTDKKTHSNIADVAQSSRGDVEKALAEADLILEHTYTTPMVHQSSIETQGVMAQPDSITGGVTMWVSTQTPFGIRNDVAGVIGVPESDVRVHAAPVGGAFGAKFGLYEPLVALLAKAVGRTVRLILTRNEELLTTNPAPPMRVDAKIGLKTDGTLTAIDIHVTLDSGIYPSGLGSFSAYMMTSFYPVSNYRTIATNVVTNKQSDGAYRAPTAPTVIFVLDTLLDEAAEKLGINPLELKMKNCAKPGDLLANDKPWPKMGMQETIEQVKAHPLWQKRNNGKAKGHGIGMAVGGWMGGIEPGAAVCKLNRDGILQVQTGSADLTGVHTVFGQLAAEAFGIAPDKVRVVYSDTDSAPYAGGVGGSKTLYTMGSAVVRAAQEARKQVLEIAAEEFEAAVDDLEIVDGKVQVKGVPEKTIELGAIASKAMTFGGKYPPIHANGRQAITAQSPGFAAQIAEVAVDEETGEVRVVNLVIIQDVGKAINPLIVEGQIQGGAVQGIGWALYEQMHYDESGQLLSGSWMDYTVPDAVQAAPLETILIEIPSDAGPFGAKGVGEPPVIPTAAAIANAIADATGARLTDLPMTAPRVLQALTDKSS
ncbi:MAG: xanthine dehydrogenase family protein molybdopterin-binding subunit [Anaerolineae bacterium]|nr:xanthine dehydrogenase family protein molybdopterin-binding subunit [Anaerolineae bacterium]